LYFKLGQFEAALADFTRTLELDRRHPRTNTQRGKCLQMLGRGDDAVKDFETAILVHEDVEAARLWLNTQQECEFSLQRLRARKASEAILSYLAGLNAEKLGDGMAAEGFFSAAIERREQEPEFWHARAQCRLAQGREQEALNDCSAAEERGADVRYSRALLYTRLQLYEQAADDLRGLPPTLSVLQALGYSLAKAGNHHEAIKVYTQALEAEPSNPQSLHNRGSSFQHLRKHAEVLFTQAIEDFTREIAARPSALAYFARGYCYELQGSADKAIADYSRSLELDM
jgi:tetratricopeptide (TPR) repeat protein